jgi:hypothetical protein
VKSVSSDFLFRAVARWFTLRRLRVHAIIFAICTWTVIAVDLSNPGLIDRSGNVKFQDFLPFYIAGKLIHEGRTSLLYDPHAAASELQAIVPHARVSVPFVYGPQVGLFFSTLGRLPFFPAALLWVIISVAVYLSCCFLVWKLCPELQARQNLMWIAALAFPPFFHFMVRGQIAVLVLICFVAAFFAFRSGHNFLAGLALGTLIFKPQFLLAIPVVLLAASDWKPLAGIVSAVAAQLTAASIYFGKAVMLAYAHMLWRLPGNPAIVEPPLAQAQMHSLRSFWLLLVPWRLSSTLYLASSILVLVLAVLAWKSSGPLTLRFSALVFAAVLINPHLFVYDLLVLAPVLLLLANWVLSNSSRSSADRLSVLLYSAYLLPLLGPLSLFTRLQVSVLAFVAIQWTLYVILSSNPNPTQSNLGELA